MILFELPYLLTIYDAWILATVFFCLIFLLDDLFVDFLALFFGLRPRQIVREELAVITALPEKKIAIVIANWKEADIIERAVAGNINAVQYANYEIYLGVYPNDTETLEAARRVTKKYVNVRTIVNTLAGPTSKGQMLNEMVRQIMYTAKTENKKPFDLLLIHDSEDVIHPNSLKLINARSEVYDYIQIPVFSLDIPVTKLTAGIYIDEFVESHTKELLVRDWCNAGVPSAGVGTALNLKTIEALIKLQNGDFLNENTLTEDYQLGLTCHDMQLKVHFSSEYFEAKNEKSQVVRNEYIATREYFPQKMTSSVKQKTRWSLGIGLQGFEARKWNSISGFGTYFLWRDRKGLLNAPLFCSSTVLAIYYTYIWWTTGFWPTMDYTPLNSVAVGLMWANLICSVFRVVNRAYLVNKIYGFKIAVLVPVRWIISNIINTASIYSALFKWSGSKVNGKQIKWSKTQHMIPEGFGLEDKKPNAT